MFNETYKYNYISERNKQKKYSKHFLRKNFEKAGEYEDKYGKDLCDFTKKQILGMYKSFHLRSLESLLSINSQFSIYTQHCIDNNMSNNNQNNFSDITSDQLLNCINKNIIKQKIISRKQLLEWTSIIDNASDVFIFLALFEGLNGKNYRELTRLSIDNFDYKKKIVTTCEGRAIPVSVELLSSADESDKEMIYYAGGKEFPLVENGRIIKDFKQTQSTVDDEYRNGRKLYVRIKKILNYVIGNSSINGKDIEISGQMYYIKKRCDELGITQREFVYDVNYRREIEKRFLTNINVTLFWKKYEGYLMSDF